MKRKCDSCEREATVHEVTIRNGEKVEKHLCDECARSHGLAVQQHAPIDQLITKFVMSQSGQPAAPAKAGTCTTCGLTFNDFRQNGLLGCPDCYKAFEPQIGPLIERAHEGATHHVGKSPRRVAGAADRQERIRVLRKQLAEAIAAEQYERAARLRDELLTAEKPGPRPAIAAELERRAEGTP